MAQTLSADTLATVRTLLAYIDGSLGFDNTVLRALCQDVAFDLAPAGQLDGATGLIMATILALREADKRSTEQE